MLYIDEFEVLKQLTWQETFNAVEASMRRVSEGRVDQAARSRTVLPNPSNMLLTMPAFLDDTKFGGMSCKIITVFPNNSKLQEPLPNLLSNIIHMDDKTGAVKAIIAGREITKWRTAAASAVATKYIYENRWRPGSSQILAIFGAGEQGKTHAHCFKHFFSFTEIRLWNRTTSRAKALVDQLNETYRTNIFKLYQDKQSCAHGADVIVTATFSPDPLVLADWVKAGAHINAVGCCEIHYSELERKLYESSDVFIDHWSGARTELKGLIDGGVKFGGEVGEFVMGKLKVVDKDRVTIFQSLGMAVEDCAAARIVYDRFMMEQKE